MGFLFASTIREYPLHLQYSTLPAAMTKHLLEIVKNLKVIKEILFLWAGLKYRRTSTEANCTQEVLTLRRISLINSMFKLYRLKDYPYILLVTSHILFH